MRMIKDAEYRNMTINQRVIASIEAIARGDEKEENRLLETCPTFNYNMTDQRYGEKLDAIRDLALAVELDMRGCILSFFIEDQFNEINFGHDFKSLMIKAELSPEHLEDMLSIRKAWHEFLSEHGIDPFIAENAFSSMRDNVTSVFLQIAEKNELEAKPEKVQKFNQWIGDYYEGR